jgi:hypothetical protein
MQALLPQSVVSSMEPVHNAEWDTLAFTIEGMVPIADLKAAAEIIEARLKPLDRETIGMLIAEVYSLTKRRKDEQIEQDFAVMAYGERLLEYPADIVAEVLKRWPDRSTWWPSWHELKKEIDWRNDRAKMHLAITKKLQPKGGKAQALIADSIRKP